MQNEGWGYTQMQEESVFSMSSYVQPDPTDHIIPGMLDRQRANDMPKVHGN